MRRLVMRRSSPTEQSPRTPKCAVYAWMPAVTILAVLLVTSWAHAAVETQNLVRNGDFEESGTPPPGWKVEVSAGESYAMVSEALTGNKALRISLPVAGSATLVGVPCAVTAGDDYVFTFWYRAVGMSTNGSAYNGCSANWYVVWQDAGGKEISRHLSSLPYGPVPDYRVSTLTVTAPAGAAKVLLRCSASVGREYKGPATALFIDQVRLMKLSKVSVPADAQKWEYLNRTLSSGMKLVDDKDAAQGQAIVVEARARVPHPYLTFGPNTTEQPVGEYLAVFRLKVKDNTGAKPVASLDVVNIGSLNFVLAAKTIAPADFSQAGAYQDFALRFVRPEEGMLEFRIAYQGGTDLSYDRKTVVQLAAFATDKEQAAIWLGSGDVAAPAAPTTGPAANPDTILVLAGMGHRTCFPTNALAGIAGLKFRHSYLAKIQTGIVLDEPFPRKRDGLNGVGIVVLAGVSASALNGFMGRTALRQFVEQGGGLLVFGGPLSLGKGEFAGSAFESALPVTITGPWDLVKAKSPRVRTTTWFSPITRGLRWSQKPVLPYYQETVAKPGSDVLLTCDGFPVLVTGRYGKGKVAVFTGTSLGVPAEDEVIFYQWPDYAELLARVVRWLSNR